MSPLSPASALRKQRRPATLEDDRVAPILSIGFRPFFLLATLSAITLVPVWLWALEYGNLSPYWVGAAWHAHEMLFGFTTAVIAGFLLTAASNWTQRRTATGWSLLGLAALWVAGRVTPLLPLSPLLVAFVDLSFIPALVFALVRPLLAARSRRNYGLLVLLSLLFAANVAMHLEQLAIHGWRSTLTPSYGSGQRWGLRIVAALILVIGGRVIPMFTRNATGNAKIRSVALLDWAALGAFAAAMLGEALLSRPAWAAVLWMAAGTANLLRMSTWGSFGARAPLLWILHVGYGATAASFVLEGLALLGHAAPTAALHLFTVGGIGALTLGMMTRVSLGHSGRHLVIPPAMTMAFALVVLAALVRALVPVLFPFQLQLWWTLSGVSWTAAFALLLRFSLRIWFSPRADRGGRA